jgi:hypothetical protein
MPPAKLKPALIGGAFIGVLSALPVVSIGNVCCCLWIVTGGLVAAYLMQQAHPAPVSPGDGAIVGLLAGLIGALVYLLVSWPMTMVVGPLMEAWMRQIIEVAGDEGLRDFFERYRGGGGRVIGLVIGLFFQIVFGAIFGTLGGLLGAVLFKKAPPEPAPPPPPPAGPWAPPPAGPPPLPPQAS